MYKSVQFPLPQSSCYLQIIMYKTLWAYEHLVFEKLIDNIRVMLRKLPLGKKYRIVIQWKQFLEKAWMLRKVEGKRTTNSKVDRLSYSSDERTVERA